VRQKKKRPVRRAFVILQNVIPEVHRTHIRNPAAFNVTGCRIKSGMTALCRHSGRPIRHCRPATAEVIRNPAAFNLTCRPTSGMTTSPAEVHFSQAQ
jgi:hypothetical protein